MSAHSSQNPQHQTSAQRRPLRAARPLAWALTLAAAAVLACGCADEQEAACRVGADCASGICNSNGTCGTLASADAAADGSTFADGKAADGSSADSQGSLADAGDSSFPTPDAKVDSGINPQDGSAVDTAQPDGDASAQPDAADAAPSDVKLDVNDQDIKIPDTGNPGVCTPNHDGTVVRAEVQLAAGLAAPYLVAQDVAVDLAGVPGEEGKLIWDFAKGFAGDKPVQVKTLDVPSQWYGSYYPGATYAARLNESTDLMGIFKLTDDALLLMGAASEKSGLLATRITYDPPVATLQFPLSVGSKWTVKSSASGQLNGVITAWSEQVEVSVGAYGILKTPMGNFPVLRVEAKTEKVLGLFTTVYRSVAFLAECFGVVGKADSAANEKNALFTNAAEVRRIAP